MAEDRNQRTRRRIVKKLRGTTKFFYAMNKDYRRIEGRLKSGHYAPRVVEGELEPEFEELKRRMDEERAYCERDCLQIVEEYRNRTHDHEGADELEELVREYVEEHLGTGYALGILSEFFGIVEGE